MKGGISNIMKQAQEMQANMEKVKKELAKTEVIGGSGSDMIKITRKSGTSGTSLYYRYVVET